MSLWVHENASCDFRKDNVHMYNNSENGKRSPDKFEKTEIPLD